MCFAFTVRFINNIDLLLLDLVDPLTLDPRLVVQTPGTARVHIGEDDEHQGPTHRQRHVAVQLPPEVVVVVPQAPPPSGARHVPDVAHLVDETAEHDRTQHPTWGEGK